MPGIPQTLEVPPPVSVQTILYGIYQALGGSGGGGGSGSAITGEGKLWFTGTAPSGWLLCNGAAVSRTTYASLFAVIGTTFGTGDDSTTFNVPDFRGRVPAGVDGVGFPSIGDMVGLSSNQIEANNLPPLNLSEVQVVSGIGSFVLDGVSYSGSASAAISNIQPTLVVNFIIKT
jgi:microcystin-dependent protein